MMALYFFHTEGVNRFHDLEGVELEESQLANQALEFLASGEAVALPTPGDPPAAARAFRSRPTT